MRPSTDPVTLVSSVVLVVVVTLLLRNVVRGLAHPVSDDDEFEALGHEMLSSLRGIDLTSPQIKELAILAIGIPGYERICKNASLEDLYALMNRYYQVVTEVADRHRGEVSHLVGEEIVIVFGRLLPVEEPVTAALDTALEIARRLSPPPPGAGARPSLFAGISAAVTVGLTISGPVGADLRKMWATFGTAPWLALRLVRAGSPGTVLAPDGLRSKTAPRFGGEAVPGLDIDGPVCRITDAGDRSASDAPGS